MLKRPLTRRSFLAGCTAVGATVACAGPTAAFAANGTGDIGTRARPSSDQIHAICQGCSNGCGFTAYVVDGKLDKAIGDASSLAAAGNLCSRGYALTNDAFAADALWNPLRRNDDGSFRTISWDEALNEISAKLSAVLEGSGPSSVALVTDGLSATATAYGSRFMGALGSANAFVDDVVRDVNKSAAFAQVIGVGEYIPDIANAQLVLMIDASYADVATPDLSAALEGARQKDIPIVAIDPRLATLGSFASEWMAVNPGTELALILAICNQLIRDGRYDKQFVQANAEGFDEWAQAIASCTSQWAEAITGVESFRIESLASKIFEAAPQVAIQYGNGAIGNAANVNASETARAVCLLNMLIGSWNQSGGALMPYDFSAASFDVAVAPAYEAEDLASALDSDLCPLGRPFGASTALALEAVRSGAIQALFALEADIAYDYASINDIESILEGLDLFVCVSQQMTQTAQLADYVLPASSYLESASLPICLQTTSPTVSIANKVLVDDWGLSNARPIHEIVESLAKACGVGDAFSFTLDEAAARQLEPLGISLEGLRQDGSAAAQDVERVEGWPTPSGKIQCASEQCALVGLTSTPQWVEPLMASDVEAVVSDDMNFSQKNRDVIIAGSIDAQEMQFRLISGQQPVLGPRGYNTAELVAIAQMYDLDSAWINSDVAAALGIATGDAIRLVNEKAEWHGKAFVTQRIVPTAIYLPSSFGHASNKQHQAFEQGFNPLLFCQPVIEEGYGTLCTQEALVRLWKEGE